MTRIEATSDTTRPGHAETTLHFANTRTLIIPIRDVAIIATLPRDDEAPWLVVSGVECSDCDMEERIYLLKANAERLSEMTASYSYPGSHSEAGINPEPFYRSRVFVGQCVSRDRNGVVWLQEEQDSTGAWVQSAYEILSGQQLETRSVERTPDLEVAINFAVNSGTCREIPGRDQYIL